MESTFLYLLEEEFTVYEGTELVNLINPGRPIVSNNFLVKYGEYVEEVGLKRVPKKGNQKNLSIEIKSEVGIKFPTSLCTIMR